MMNRDQRCLLISIISFTDVSPLCSNSCSEKKKRVCVPSELALLLCLLISLFSPSPIRAQDNNLSDRQSGVAQRYERLEELLLRLAEMESTENPERAALLRRAAKQSSEQLVLNKLKTASEALREAKFQEAVEKQKEGATGLSNLLKLLMSEDRSKRIRDEKKRIANLIKNLKRVERSERSTRARTENGADLKDVQAEQESLIQRSEELKRELRDESKETDEPESESNQSDSEPREPEENGSKPSEPNPSKSESSESKPSDAKQSDSKQPESNPSDSKSQDSKPNGTKPSESKPESQKPSQSKPGNSKPTEQQTPQTPQRLAEQQLEKAIENMRQAEQELENQKRDGATQKQRQAEENLRAAIDRLEQILRQLREEEMQRELAKLEARLRRMAAMQSKVLDDTIALAETPKSQRNRQTDLKAGDLAFEEKKITLEADRAMLLLREEGSSVAFPEVVSQIRSDTSAVAERLGETKIDSVTQGIQQDILAALEEMITALQKAQRDLEKKRQQQQGKPQSGGQKEQPLVQKLAELKLLRTMESRIKSTTSRYGGLLKSEESTPEEVLPLLQDLSERQNRLYQITRDLVQKRNQ